MIIYNYSPSKVVTITNFNEAKSRIRQILQGVDHLAVTYMYVDKTDRLIDGLGSIAL